MIINKIKWKNHPILGNLKIDLNNTNTGKPYKNIILVGENGTGKTTILESISTFLRSKNFSNFEYIEYIINDEVYTIVGSDERNRNLKIKLPDGNVKTTNINSNYIPGGEDNDEFDIRQITTLFSKARADYRTNSITTTTSKKLDEELSNEETDEDFTSLKQLIVDIENQDNNEYADLNKSKGNNPIAWPEFYIRSKIFRFKNAFNNFFEELKYDKVIQERNQKKISFTKNGSSVSIDELSTGEKQIVFRGIYLLKNSNKLDNSLIMIDEPELSMHPKWQQKLLDYYTQLFTKEESQFAQIIFASHSDHVLKDALSDQANNLIIVLENNSGTITSKRIDTPTILPSITSAETSYLAFDIASNDYHIELYGYLQNKESLNTVKSCDNFIVRHFRFNNSIHRKTSSHGTTTYNSLTTYIRNAIDHPDPSRTFTEEELRISIKLLIDLCS